MITLEEQQKLFLNVSKKLKKQIIVYAVGGTAMTFLGLKDTTLDIDLVFETKTIKKYSKPLLNRLDIDHLILPQYTALKVPVLRCLLWAKADSICS